MINDKSFICNEKMSSYEQLSRAQEQTCRLSITVSHHTALLSLLLKISVISSTKRVYSKPSGRPDVGNQWQADGSPQARASQKSAVRQGPSTEGQIQTQFGKRDPVLKI